MQAGLAEHPQVGVDSAGLTALADPNSADEMGGAWSPKAPNCALF
jgi:hypothetical protein